MTHGCDYLRTGPVRFRVLHSPHHEGGREVVLLFPWVLHMNLHVLEEMKRSVLRDHHTACLLCELCAPDHVIHLPVDVRMIGLTPHNRIDFARRRQKQGIFQPPTGEASQIDARLPLYKHPSI